MMISRTSMTSTSGVTLMSDFMPPLAPPTSIAMVVSPQLSGFQLSALSATASRFRISAPLSPSYQHKAESQGLKAPNAKSRKQKSSYAVFLMK
jgi:hypothetical protein